ncbi:unnamed protein product [Ectocarpus sp. CCAP 1310/34]|nr:unnamed protein product [Ectocarpus sp. CCAP 1310/34]
MRRNFEGGSVDSNFGKDSQGFVSPQPKYSCLLYTAALHQLIHTSALALSAVISFTSCAHTHGWSLWRSDRELPGIYPR